MERRLKELFYTRFLNNFSRVHYDDPLRHFGHDSHCVSDQENGHAKSGFHFPEKIENLSLDSHIECRRRFVCDEQFWVAGQRHCDHHALSHSTRELVWVVAGTRLRFGDMNEPEHFNGFVECLPNANPLMQPDSLGYLFADSVDRVKGGHWFLEHHADLLTAYSTHSCRVERNQITSEPDDLALSYLSRWHGD
jgi:hypothetical protein